MIRPSAWWYAACAIPLIACVVLGVLLVVGGLALAGAVVGLVAILRHRSKVKLERERLYAAGGWGGPPGG